MNDPASLVAPEPETATEPDSQARPVDATAWLSWLRFIAIVGVVSIHTAGYTAAAAGARDRLEGQLAIALDIGAIFTVPLFVMISGALLLDPKKFHGTEDFLRKRAIRLVPAIIFWNLFYWGFRVVFLKQHVDARTALDGVLTGRLYTALYFFWIVLGLALVAPLLIPWIATATRRSVIVVGAIAAAMPVLTIATYSMRGGGTLWVETPWTWWIFYLGYFILGWGLRGVVLRKSALVGACALAIAIGTSLVWEWRNPDAPSLLTRLSPVSYYGLGVHIYAVLIFLIAQSLIRSGGMLEVLARGSAAKVGRLLGDATLGVFVLHLAVLGVLTRLSVAGDLPAVDSVGRLLLRIGSVLTVTYVIVLVLRRVPVIRRVL